jgi:class 3 adenylate cyclase/tetratricopeptide (TPR) repeat protein
MKSCPVCGEENPARARFCIACGNELPVEAERRFRKVITLLFCDLVDGARLPERLGPEDLSAVLTAYYEATRPIIERHGGTVARFIGDAIMSVFGVPVLHEDDALRACRAALEMQTRLDELNDELERQWGLRLACRMGINTGEVSGVGVARAQNFVAGDAANTAARFQQNAAAGQILFGEETRGLVRSGVRVEEVEPLQMKGKEGPVRAFNLLEVLAGAEALLRRHDAPLVGRREELATIETAFRTAVEERRCELVTLLADAGVGKSRLVEELVTRIGEDGLVLRGRCLSYGEGITFWPLVGIVRRLANVEDDDTPEVARRKLAAVAGRDAADAAERVASVIGLSDTEFPLQEIFWGTRKLLERAAEDLPLIIVFDDVHWAEPALLDLVEHLLEHVSDCSVLLLCPARPEFLERRRGWRDRPDITNIRLKPLSDEEVATVIANMLGDVELAGDARRRVVDAAEGNPLFVEQMLSMMLDEGLLERVDGRLEATANLHQISVPPSISALLAARIDHLPPPERAVVDPASVVGVVFAQATVEALTTESVGPELPAQLERLADKQLVRPNADSDQSDAYRFNHVLIRDAAYEGLLKETRASLHERVAEWTERLAAEHEREAEFEEILGYHLEQAHRYRAELGPLDEHGRGLGARAAGHLSAAGRRAFQRSDMQAAANLLGRAAALLDHNDVVRVALLPDLAEALVAIGELPRALQVVDEAAAEAEAAGSEELLAEAVLVRIFIRALATEAGWGPEILPEIDRRMSVLERAEQHSGLAKGWRLLGAVHGTACRFGEAADAVQQALLHARLAGDRRQELRNTSAYAQALLLGPTPVPEAIDECKRILERAGGDRATRAFVLAVLALLQSMSGAFDETRVSYVSARALYEDLGSTVLAAWVSLQSGPAELLAGNLATAERELRRAYDALEAIGEKYFFSSVAAYLGRVLFEQGRDEEALAASDSAHELATEDDVVSQALWRAVRARVLARAGEVDEALTLAQESVALAHRTDSPMIQADALLDLAVVLRATGRDPDSVIDEAVTLYERKGNTVAARAARELRAGAPRPEP